MSKEVKRVNMNGSRGGGGMCVRTGRGGEDVSLSNRRGARCMRPLARTRGVRATCDSDSVAEAGGSLMFPEVLGFPTRVD